MRKLSLQQARKRGEKFYFTGKPCRAGHISKRYVTGKTCHACNTERNLTRHKTHYQAMTPSQVIALRIASCKWRAMRDGLLFEPLQHLLLGPPTNCPCCQCVLDYTIGNGKSGASPSLDRLNSLSGYTVANTHVICARCNQIKNSGNANDHKRIAAWIDSFH